MTEVVADRARPGDAAPVRLPAVRAHDARRTALRVVVVDLPGRPLVSRHARRSRSGAGDEPDALGGAIGARGPRPDRGHRAVRRDRAGRGRGAARRVAPRRGRLGRDVHRRRRPGGPARARARAAGRGRSTRPTFPEAEVERLRDERLNDLLQARADPRRRADEAFVATIYAPDSPYRRPAGGTRETGREPRRRIASGAAYRRGPRPRARDAHRRRRPDRHPTSSPIAERLFGRLAGRDRCGDRRAGSSTTAAVDERVRPRRSTARAPCRRRSGSAIAGLPRRIPDFHALSVMGAILGGLFNSRLNMKLREEKGYTYGASAGFDLRRAAGPFAARAAVNTEVTVPAIVDVRWPSSTRIRDERVDRRGAQGRPDFLVGVFPLRFETPGPGRRARCPARCSCTSCRTTS